MTRYKTKNKCAVGWRMIFCLRIMVLKLIILALCSTTASIVNAQPSITYVDGMTEDGAFYLIAVPPNWNGNLVIYNHGLTLNPPGPLTATDLGPPYAPSLRDIQLAEGYAVAASSYRLSGWAMFKTKNDLQNMLDVFKDQFGEPDQVIVTGSSLGGAVTAQAIEEGHVGNLVGAYSLCGALAGSRNWDGALDLRMVYDVVAKGTPGAEIPGGAEGLPEGSTLTTSDIILRVNKATGILLPPDLRTSQQVENLGKMLSVMQTPENLFLRVMFYATLVMSDLVHDIHKLNGELGTGNVSVNYDDVEINENIVRVAPQPGAENRLERYFTPTGGVGDVKIISIHTDKDGIAVVENESDYGSVVPAENLTVAIAVEDVPSHCNFTAAEVVAGWESLRAWIAGSPQPSAHVIQSTCLELSSPAFPGPCRFDPTFVIPDMDGRIRPR